MSTFVSASSPSRRARAFLGALALASLIALALAVPLTASAASSISGVLRDQGTGVHIVSGDVAMSLERLDGRVWVLAASQNATIGVYSFSGLEAGSYRLRQDTTSPYSYFPPKMNPGSAIAVDGVADVTSDWPLVRTGFGAGASVISGDVIDDATGATVAGPTIWVSLDQLTPEGTWAHIADSFRNDGTYSFGALGSGRYRVRYQGKPPTGYEFRGYQTSPALTVDGTGDAGYDFRLWSQSTPVPASSAWSLVLVVVGALGVMAVRSRRA